MGSSPNPLGGLESCRSVAELRQYHSQVIRQGLSTSNDATGRLIRFLALSPSGDFPYALRLLRHLPSPDPFIYNTLLRSPHSSPATSARLFSLMPFPPNPFTFPSLLTSLSLSRTPSPPLARQLHAHLHKRAFHSHRFSNNALLNLYLACSLPDHALLLLRTMHDPDVVSYTTLITGLSRLGMLAHARNLFDHMPHRNSVSWNAMISGYAQCGRFTDAFEVFDAMVAEGIPMNRFVAASMLSACTGTGALERGRYVHREIERNGIELDGKLATTVIDMYCKCGCLDTACEVFTGLGTRGIASWNCMIGGLATHGRGEDAIELFKEMEREETVVPDDITLLNVLTACAHTGMVDEGRGYFEYMVDEYAVQPKMEHYGCLVDLLGRAGLLEEAEKVIDEMPMTADAGVLGALLGACKIHGNVELGEKIGRRVIELDPGNSGRYVLLANLFASAGRWDNVADVRRLMNDRGVNKEAGCSVIELCGGVHEFIAGGMSHPQSREIYAKVNEMLGRIKSEGYKPDTKGVLHDIDEDEKENPLYFHSEKLAIAFGLLHTVGGDTIRISKNLRVCRDCHEASKIVSKVYDRKIIVRDRNRFHHFKGGECSCKDYW